MTQRISVDGKPQIERRQFVRIRLEAEVRYARADNENSGHKPVWTTALLCDVSGGGARITTRERLELKDAVILELPIDGKPLYLKSSVKRVQPARPGEPNTLDIGIEFVDIQQSERDKIVSLVFRMQLNLQRQAVV